ncbi:hypothetical protein FEM03_02370 [Phragmitibacter flavus]|uniref:PD-(D/E)XK endonuclease-like domain-containing protein n=1 Tax=Phragmitibacter flavus TaxID=2576071 RepID=A0A5R8KJ02_9BACT|nr:PD-(D/E)XK nuclease family protein [Phragmitibacter flavus]TLD72221.1 hypothetical protein FEM03_02370 [Phragmitibacter flavus]
MSGLKLSFWGWDEPVLTRAVRELLKGWMGGLLDLSDRVILVPTAETGRRLREALARAVAEQEGAAMVPFVWHPEAALTFGTATGRAASSVQEQLAWMMVLQGVRAEEVKVLFPGMAEGMDEGWVSGMAETLAALKRTLGAGGQTMASVAEQMGEEMDGERWRELAGLEETYLRVLKGLGVEDGQALKRSRSMEPVLPEGVKKVSVFAMADPPRLLREWMLKVGSLLDVEMEIFVYANAQMAGMFDGLGVPRLETWGQGAGLVLPMRDEDLLMVATPRDQATAVMGVMRGMAQEGLEMALGSGDPALTSHLEAALAAEEVRAFDPAGRQAEMHALTLVLKAWQRVLVSGLWQDVAAFLRLDDVLRVAGEGVGLGPTRVLGLLDELQQAHLPPTLEEAVGLCGEAGELRAVLLGLQGRVREWEGAGMEVALRGLLGWVYGGRTFDTSHEVDVDYAKLVGEAIRLAGELDAGRVALGLKVGAGALLGVLLDELSAVRLADVRGEVDFVLHGWLELPWEPAPGLVVAGFNEEYVPGIVTGDAFLPDGLRKRLGLACQDSRRARDAYLLRSMVEQRRDGGAFRVVLGRVNEQGEGLRPSRLLFDCEDEALVGRVRRLFPDHAEEGKESDPPRSVGFLLRPKLVEKELGSISPTGIRAYLSCPFRYYLQQVLRMEQVESGLREASAMDFGNLVHAVLQEYAKAEGMKECVDAKAIAGWLDGAVSRLWEKQFGKRPLLSVVMQLESARQRLLAAAEGLAELRSAGWRTVMVEENAKVWGLRIGGVLFSGQVDRVDRRSVDGVEEFLVLDYKTGKRKKPVEAHWGKVKAGELMEGFEWQMAEGGEKRWVEVQLPLYAWAVGQKNPGRRVQVGYFHLPATVTESGVTLWEDLDAGTVADAVRCAEEAVSRIKARIFWPPADEVRNGDFEFLLGDPLLTVDPSALMEGMLKR